MFDTLRRYFSVIKTLANIPQQHAAGGMDGGYGSLISFLGGFNQSRINFAREVGDLRLSSLVMSAVRYIGDGINDARFKVSELDSDNKETEIKNHELSAIFAQPNGVYDSASLWRGFAFSWIAAGECYFVKSRSKAPFNRLINLWYEPHWTIRPRWVGNDFISYFEIERDGVWYRIETSDVFALYDGIDPLTRRGFSATGSMLREHYTDQQAGQMTSLFLRSGLFPPGVIGIGDKSTPGPGAEQLQVIKSDLYRQMSGDTVGRPFVFSGPVTAAKLGYDYNSYGMKEIRETPEERFCATIGISPISLLLGAGNKNTTYSNTENFFRFDYQRSVMRINKRIAQAATNRLLPEFGDSDGLQCGWDYTQAPLAQKDKVSETKRTAILYTTGGIDRAEYREANDYKMRPEDKDVYYARNPKNGNVSPESIKPSTRPKSDENDGVAVVN